MRGITWPPIFLDNKINIAEFDKKKSNIKTLDELIKILDTKLKNKGKNIKKFKEIVDNYQGTDWYKINVGKVLEKKYNRTLIYKNLHYEILILSWGKGATSKIHNHSLNGCIYKILFGKLQEKKYNKKIMLTGSKELSSGESGYIDNDIGYHKITNINDSISYSLHIYSPPGYKCKKIQM